MASAAARADQPNSARWYWLALGAVTLAAFALRVYRLGDVPAGLFCDEAAAGYNAYSLLHTGRDEHGRSFPLFIWSFFAFKYPLDIYPSMLWVGLFGLTEFATRLQAALYGTATMVVAFLLGRQVFGPLAGLAAAVALAVMPWHFHFSRIAFSLVGFPFFFGLGVYFLMRATGAAPTRRDWLWAAANFALCLYVYAVSQLMVPLYVGVAVMLAAPAVWRQRRWALQAAGLALLIALPFAIFYLRHLDRASVYVQQVSVLVQPIPLSEKLDLILRQNWPVYFGPEFLLRMGDPILRHGVRGHGVLYLSLVVAAAVGAVACLFQGGRSSKLLLLWLVLYPLGAAVTRETPSATRSFLGTLIFALLAGVGFERVVALLRRVLPWRWPQRIAVAAFTVAAVVPLARESREYLHHYFTVYPTYAAVGIEGFQYGYRDLLRLMEERRTPDTAMVYSTTSVNNPYIYELFYLRRPPLRLSEWGNAETDYLGVRPMELERWYVPGRPTLFAAVPTDLWFFESWDERVDIDGPGGVPAFILLRNPKPKHFIESWQLLAAFDNPVNEKRLAVQVDPVTMQAVEPVLPGFQPRWEPYRAAAGVVELNQYLGERIPGSAGNPEFINAYLRTAIKSPDAHTAVLELVGSRDEMIIWLNGAPITVRPLMLTESEIRTVPLPLRAGDNTLLIKAIETVGDWWFSARLARPDGSADDTVVASGAAPR